MTMIHFELEMTHSLIHLFDSSDVNYYIYRETCAKYLVEGIGY